MDFVSQIIKDPLSKVITVAALRIAAHFFKKHAKSIESKIEKIPKFEQDLDESIDEMKKDMRTFKNTIELNFAKVTDDLYRVKRDLIDSQNEIFKKIRHSEYQVKKTRLKLDTDIIDKINRIEKEVIHVKKVQTKNEKNVLDFSRRIAMEFKRVENESGQATRTNKKIFEDHKQEIQKQKKRIAEIETAHKKKKA